jgi:hypothetical protein
MPAQRSLAFASLLTIAAGAVCACVDPTGVAPSRRARADAATTDVADGIVPYGVGTLRRRAPGTPCATGNFRQFDFWVGDWAVINPAGTVTATNRIVTDLDGCAVMENWRPSGGFVGRSLNSWDAEAGVWRQVWVPSRGRPFRMAGVLRPDGVMDLTGTRVHAVIDARYVDHYWWETVSADQVRQNFTFDLDAFDIHQRGSILYTRQATLPTTVPQADTRCKAGGDTQETRALDATVGAWQVRAEPGPTLGASTIAVDVEGCLFEERFTTPKGYASIVWTYYDPIVQRWHRSIVDSEGERIELVGVRDGDVLTLEGDEPIPGHADARLRVVQRTDVTGVQQQWSVSVDKGATWREVRTIAFARATP